MTETRDHNGVLSGLYPFGPNGPCCIEFAPRQQEIIALVADGFADKEIAIRLGVSTRTIRTHLERLFQRYGIHSRSAAVALWLRSGGIRDERF